MTHLQATAARQAPSKALCNASFDYLQVTLGAIPEMQACPAQASCCRTAAAAAVAAATAAVGHQHASRTPGQLRGPRDVAIQGTPLSPCMASWEPWGGGCSPENPLHELLVPATTLQCAALWLLWLGPLSACSKTQHNTTAPCSCLR